MSEQPKPTETATPQPVSVTPPAETTQAAQATKTAAELQAELERVEKALKEANKEAASRRKRLEELEADEAKRKEAQLSETDKLKAALDKATGELATLKLTELKRQAAAKHKLPEALVMRLQGNTLEELEKDAEELAKTLPKATIPATNPGMTSLKTTDEELKQRLWGNAANIFNQAWAEKHGGGVISVTKKED